MLKSYDGKVFYREWNCVGPKAVIILVHGMGGHSGRFFEMGPYLARAGLQIYAIEQKGHGESPSIKGHILNFKLYTEDLKGMVLHARKQHPGKKIFVFGESMGGLIAIDFALHYQRLVDGLILMSPAIKEKLPMSFPRRFEIFINAIFNPMKYFSAEFDASIFTRDKLMVKRINSDQLEARCFTARFYISILKAITYVNMHPKRIKKPVFMILGGQDLMIDAKAGEKYFGKMSSVDKTLKWYPDMYHALYIDKDRETVFKDMIEWVGKRS
jgi:alpha-beta hydrolase superfamily lysophospholipase